MLNAGIETKLSILKRLSSRCFRFPLEICFGNRNAFAIGSLEICYYFTEILKNWYVAANTGEVDLDRMQKYNILIWEFIKKDILYF